jgi:pentatricopeptide repeat protein
MFSRLLEHRKELDVISWTSMIAAYAHFGKGREAIEVFHEMVQEGIKPNAVTFINILYGFSHSSLVNDALHFYKIMKSEYNIQPTLMHQNCIVGTQHSCPVTNYELDTLSRAGQLNKAESFIEEISAPDIVTWMSLLAGSVWYKDLSRAERVAAKALKLDAANSSVYVLLANLYADLGMWDKQEEIRKIMEDKSIKKIPGLSKTELQGKSRPFYVHDDSHELSEDIYALSDRHHEQAIKAGYTPDVSCVLHKATQEEKEILIRRHRFNVV